MRTHTVQTMAAWCLVVTVLGAAAWAVGPAADNVPARRDAPPAPGPAEPEEAEPPAAAAARSPADIRALIEQLGADSYPQREAAQKELERCGSQAIGPLRAALDSDDVEVRVRAKAALAAIRKRLAAGQVAALRKGRLWQVPLPAEPGDRLVVAEGVALLLTGDKKLRARDAAQGKELWTFASQAGHFAVAGKMVYVVDTHGKLQALEVHTGKARAGFAPVVCSGAPAVVKGTVYVAGADGKTLLAVDAATGKVARTWDLPAASNGVRPAVAGDVVAVALQTGRLALLDRTGQAKGREFAPEEPHALRNLTSDGQRLYVRQAYRVLAVDPAAGKQLWSCDLSKHHPFARMMQGNVRMGWRGAAGLASVAAPRDAAPLVADGALYVTVADALVAIDTKSGQEKWSYQPKGDSAQPAGGPDGVVIRGGNAGVRVQVMVQGGAGQVKRLIMVNGRAVGDGAPPAVAGSAVLVTTPLGLHAVDRKTGAELWTLPQERLGPAGPAVADGVVYVATGAQRHADQAQAAAALSAYRLPENGGQQQNTNGTKESE